MLDAGRRIPQRPVRVVQVRGALEACQPFRGRRVVKVVRMKLAAQVAKAALEVLRVDPEAARQAKEREEVPEAAERQNAIALRAEMLVDRGASAAVAALERRCGAQRNRVGSHMRGTSPAAHQAPKELPQPQVCFAFGLWKTKPCVSSAVS